MEHEQGPVQFRSRRAAAAAEEGEGTHDGIPPEFETLAASRADVLRAAAWIEERVLSRLPEEFPSPGLLRMNSDDYVRLRGDVNRLETRLVKVGETTSGRMARFLHEGRWYRRLCAVLLLLLTALVAALLMVMVGHMTVPGL